MCIEVGKQITWFYNCYNECAGYVLHLTLYLFNLLTRVKGVFDDCFNREPEISDLKKSFINSTGALRKKVAVLKERIKIFDDFIHSHPDLKAVVRKKLLKHQQLYADNFLLREPEPECSDEIIAAWGKAKQEEIDFESIWDNRVFFVMTQRSVRECALKHINKIMKSSCITENERKVIALLPFFTSK